MELLIAKKQILEVLDQEFQNLKQRGVTARTATELLQARTYLFGDLRKYMQTESGRHRTAGAVWFDIDSEARFFLDDTICELPLFYLARRSSSCNRQYSDSCVKFGLALLARIRNAGLRAEWAGGPSSPIKIQAC